MALGYLLILFIVLAVVSGLGISLLYLVKNQKAKTIIFYSLSVLSMGIAFINATGLPSNYLFEQLIAWSFGLLAVVAILIKIKKPEQTTLVYLLVTASVICGLADLFFF